MMNEIQIYDDVFPLGFRTDLYRFCLNSNFRIGWADNSSIETSMHRSLHCTFSIDDIERLGLLKAIRGSKLADELAGYVVSTCVLNLSTPADVNFVHVHGEDKVLLFYVNLVWQDGYHGETLFLTEDQKSVRYASLYTPNRVVSFNAKIPHTIRPQSYLSPFYRFTLSLMLKKTTDET